MRFPLIVAAAACLAACSPGARQAPAAGFAEIVDPYALARPTSGPIDSYRIGPSDKLALRVFQVEDLSFDEIFVDASGELQLPLIGSVPAAGLTPAELAQEIETRLGEQFLRDPRVIVTVVSAASQKITVDGAVTTPGVFEMRGRTTLMQAVAMAQGPSNTADLRSVAVFRRVEGRRMVGVFDLAAIRAGQQPDPVLLGDDVVVVDTSRLSATMREVLQALPGFAVFAYL